MASFFSLTSWGVYRGLPSPYVWYEAEEEDGGRCQVGVRTNVPFQGPGCTTQLGGSGCCEGTHSFVWCHSSGDVAGGQSFGDVYCLP